jgi:NAD(P)H-flavin reductase
VPRTAEVLAITRETSDVVTLHVRDRGAAPEPGQFLQLSLPTIGEAPISVSGVSRAEGFVDVELTIRGVGATTRALTNLEPGSELGVRGPYGRGWPLPWLEGAPVVIVAGGVGLAPLRGAIRALVEAPDRFPDVRLFVGARTPEDLLFPREMITWLERSHVKLTVTVDHASPGWRGHVGVVTRLLRRGAIPEHARALVCGPEIMMRFTSDALLAAGVPHDRQWLTMERHMKCAVGFCGRCQMGPHLVCRDGPVFRRDELVLLGREGF